MVTLFIAYLLVNILLLFIVSTSASLYHPPHLGSQRLCFHNKIQNDTSTEKLHRVYG